MLEKLGLDMLNEDVVKGFIGQAMKGQSREEAMHTLYEIRSFIDGMGGETFGRTSWKEFCKAQEANQ